MGVKPLPEALEYSKTQDLDLVEVAPNASPPVCRVMDYNKFKYDQQQRQKEARKKQAHVSVKEMKFRPKIDEHDYATKVRHVERFLKEGSKVKLTIMFRGREVSHPELGKRILDRVADEVEDFAEVENFPRIDGRNMTMVLAPLRDGRRRKKDRDAPPPSGAVEEPAEEPAETSEPEAEAEAEATAETEPELAEETAS